MLKSCCLQLLSKTFVPSAELRYKRPTAGSIVQTLRSASHLLNAFTTLFMVSHQITAHPQPFPTMLVIVKTCCVIFNAVLYTPCREPHIAVNQLCQSFRDRNKFGSPATDYACLQQMTMRDEMQSSSPNMSSHQKICVGKETSSVGNN